MSIKRFISAISLACSLGLFATALTLSGCAPKYAGPSMDEPTATVSFEAKADASLGYMAFLLYHEDPNAIHCSKGRQRLAVINQGNPLGGKSENLSHVPIPAGRKIAISSGLSPANIMGQYGCGYTHFFVPVSGKDYLISLFWDDNKCKSYIYDVTEDDKVLMEFEQKSSKCF